MKMKLLCAAVLAASFAQVSVANDHDDRWYVTGSAGLNLQDSNRTTSNAAEVALGFGKFFSEEWSFDVSAYSTNPSFENAQNLNFSQYGLSADLRRHFMKDGRNWWPYLKAGLGLQRAEEEFNAFPSPNSPGQRKDNNLALALGAGLQADYDNYAIRAEFGPRISLDDASIAAASEDRFVDWIASVGLVIPLGAKAEAAPPPVAPPPPAAPSCESLDDDGDGVNNCNDKCPGSQAGQAIGPDGCAVPLTIDLKGVNFDFDKATLRPDAVAILTEAVEILKKYPQLKVEVAGHTDSVGSDAYNQGLSQRRAQAVYDYLTSNGVDAGRLVGPNGFGESRPIDSNDTAEGRAKNRRTELNVQN